MDITDKKILELLSKNAYATSTEIGIAMAVAAYWKFKEALERMEHAFGTK